ncbi:MAG: glycoside hydrolase family 3 protein [Desulfopila sp.]
MDHLHTLLGQLFILGFHGSILEPGNPIIDDITRRYLGGVILFDNFLSAAPGKSNIVSPQQVQELCSELQALTPEPLIIGVDQEGGMVRRLKERHGFAPLPSAAQMAEDTTYAKTAQSAEATAHQLAATGVNLNFAPVADLNINPNNPIIGKIGRSFSPEPATVTEHCEIWLDALQRAGVYGCLKHFPGHGSAHDDSHKDFVDITHTWRKKELLPYQKLIARQKVHAIMLGHLFHGAMDSHHPASLSPSIATTMLRRQLNFQGLVLTDDLQMHAITKRYGLLDAVVQAFAAGVDQVIIGNNLEYAPNILQRIFHRMEEALRQGTISMHRLEQAYERTQRFKTLL